MKRARESIFTQEARLTYWQTRPHVCGICGKPIKSISDMHLDHMIPVSKGGETQPDNVQLAHAACNLRKSDKVAGNGSPVRSIDERVEGFASRNGWFPLCYSVQNGWYGIAVACLRGGIGLMKDAGRYCGLLAYARELEIRGESTDKAWPFLIGAARQFADLYFDHEVDVERAISIYQDRVSGDLFEALKHLTRNCGVKYSEYSPHHVQYYDKDEDWRRR